MSKTRHERVSEDEEGQRIDNFLIRRCPGVPRSHIYRLIRKGDVRVDGKRIKQTRKLATGEQVRIPALRVQVSDAVHVPDRLARTAGRAVLLDHEDFLVVDKPAGIAVHGGSGLAFGFIDALRQQLDEPGLDLAHRLDRATSGCLLIGRSLKANRALQNLFRRRQITKRYIALVDGQWPADLESVQVPLKKNVEHAGERRVRVDTDGRPALTHFRIQRRFGAATMMEVLLETGRTHQIRVHARHVGHGVVGDTRYGDNARNAWFRQKGLNRLYLHSSALEFTWHGERIAVQAPLDEAWQASLVALCAASEPD
ncbi:MAG: RluA family pseudouridine synthase [Granulosicoccus sp.]|nr:RluA family pseudouridine synthase [Granulosicoccus sp.]